MSRRGFLAGSAALLAVAATPPVARAATSTSIQFNGPAVVDAAGQLIGRPYALREYAGKTYASNTTGFGHNPSSAGPTLCPSGPVDWANGAIDCSGLVRAAYFRAGIDLGAGGTNTQWESFDQVGLFGRLTGPEQAVPGDVLYFGYVAGSASYRKQDYVDPSGTSWDLQHAAIYTGGSGMIDSNPTASGSSKGPGVQSRQIFRDNPASGWYLVGYFHIKNDASGTPIAATAQTNTSVFSLEDDMRLIHDGGTGVIYAVGTHNMEPVSDMDHYYALAAIWGPYVDMSPADVARVRDQVNTNIVSFAASLRGQGV